jgi:DNA-binding transcriptional regulator YhcF (GntR family)
VVATTSGTIVLVDRVEAVELVDLVSVDPVSPVPPFQQVRDQVAAAIEHEDLRPDVRLPTVRQLAADLGLAANTVARSYRELELAGLLETRGRHGTFVAGTPSPARKVAAREARSFARRMRALGLGDEETMAILRREVDHLGSRPAAGRRPGR